MDQSYVAPHLRMLGIERVVKKHACTAPGPAVERTAEQALGESLRVIDCALTQLTYLAGEVFTRADVSLMPYVGTLSMVGADHLLPSFPRVEAWWLRVSARPSWQQATAERSAAA